MMVVMLGKKCRYQQYNRATTDYPVARLIVKTKTNEYKKEILTM